MRSQRTNSAPFRRSCPEAATGRRRLVRRCSGSLIALAISASAGSALAQNDISPPLPDVLLLVDTSGSMEYKVGGSAFPACYPDGSLPSEKSRWVDLVEVLTGTIKNYRCQNIDRQSVSFRDGEYGTGGPLATAPYDYLYPTPYHRPMSGGCVRGPGTLTGNVWEFPDTAFKEHPYNSLVGTCTSPFTQANDGILDAFERSIRFGLMTFDPESGNGVVGKGYSGASTPNYADGVTGTWSYVWGSPVVGKPAGCTVDQAFEVGARNAAAPPWEGKLIPFGNPRTDQYLTKKEQIKKVLLGTRPYGPTPIAGMMKDARDFLTSDTSKDPLDTSQDFGPYADPFVIDPSFVGGCRKRFVILLSDGQPNMDLRPDCGTSSSSSLCPFWKPEDIALELKTPTLITSQRSIQTFVIGFALPKFNVKTRGEVTCNDLDSSEFSATNPSALCNSTDPDNRANTALQACCSLNRIAVAGGTGEKPRALFADNRDELSSALSQILTKTTTVTSRTQPVIAGAAAGSQGFRFYSSVRPISFQPWVGILQRERYECVDKKPKAMPVSKESQDDFAANLNAHPDSRNFVSIRAGNGSETVNSRRTIRPLIASSGVDGAGTYGGSRYIASQSTFASKTSPEMIDVDDGTCTTPAANAATCRDRYLNWLVGLPNGTPFSRCSASECYLMGDILHSTPRVVGPPSAFVVDESYDRFSRDAALRKRPIVLYTSTNDGFLHAFKVAADDDPVKGVGPLQNEMWAFIPPAVLPHLRKQYPFAHFPLLDGAPQVLDVVATAGTNADNLSEMKFERSQADAQKGLGTWRTVLLQSFGVGGPVGGGYFALDVTSPQLDPSDLTKENVGPRFLWQLTTYGTSGVLPLFGKGGTPAIATLFFAATSTSEAKEIPVAILPGGAGQPGTLGPSPGYAGCSPSGASFSNFETFKPRAQVKCYTTADDPARSLTIVRLDTGEIVRTFRRTKDEITDADLKKRVVVAPLDSPIAGQPVAFPSDTGAIADRAYVGDQDGRLWKVDLSSTNPDQWKMELFFDAYPASTSTDASFTNGPGDGQPLSLPPVISVDDSGNITVNVSTGDQDTTLTSVAGKNFVWSLTEKVDGTREHSVTHVNWYLPLTSGERVVGPMSLFNSQLFFSSYAPPSAATLSSNACNSGKSKVWGMDYLRPASDTSLAAGGVPRLPKYLDPGKFVQYLEASQAAGNANAVIFGVSVAQEPSCVQTADTQADNFFGYKAETKSVKQVTPGKFQLVMHIGGVESQVRTDDLQANVRTIDLEPPPSAARVDSWAALVE